MRRWCGGGAADGEAVAPLVIVRPEKLRFCEPGASALPGRMKTRIFQGNHWLCQVDTEVGEVLVIRQNDGVAVPAEGEAVHLTWRAADMRPVEAPPPVNAA